MTQQVKLGIMTLEVDDTKVVFLCAGSTATTIHRPFNVGVLEWMAFWGGEEASQAGVFSSSFRKDPHDDAVRKHKIYREREKAPA